MANDELIAALERAANMMERPFQSAPIHEAAALIRAHIETLRNGGERAQLDKWLRGDEAFKITGSVFTEDLADAIAAGAHVGGE